VDAYLHGIEMVEIELKSIDRSLEGRLEQRCADYRSCIAARTPLTRVYSCYRELIKTLDEVEVALTSNLKTGRSAAGFAFFQAAAIILREGIEAALLLGVMLTYLTVVGYRSLRRHVLWGGLAGVLLGVITWAVAQTLIEISPLHREALEGLTSLLAAAVLFSVSLWIIHNADVQRWKNYIRSRAESAIGAGPARAGFALAFAAFLAVYREAFETVLFYQVLWMKEPAGHAGIAAGFIAGAIVLAVVMVALFRFGMRIPLKPFFAATGAMLGALVFVFAGYGIRELQNIGWIKETLLPVEIQWRLLEIHPTVEGVGLQFAVLLAFLLGWLFARQEQMRPRQVPSRSRAEKVSVE
jgi:high-affinity iron transporter